MVKYTGMISDYAMGLSRQAISLYKLLLKSTELSAAEIGRKLQINKNHVYRLTRHLIVAGLVEKSSTFPVRFKAKPINEARMNYLNQQGMWFSSHFTKRDFVNTFTDSEIAKQAFNISFFQSRDEHIEHFVKQSERAKFSIHFIALVLPIGVSQELMRAHHQAVTRGVDVKLIALEHTKENNSILMSYKKMGVQVRVGKVINFHLFLIDDHQTTINLFDPIKKEVQTGVNFESLSINKEMQLLFNTYWQKGTQPHLEIA